MKLLIAGSRSYAKQHKKILALVDQIVRDKGWTVTAVISHCAKGVDQVGQSWAEQNGIDIIRKPLMFGKHGVDALTLRNKETFDMADAAIIIQGDKPNDTINLLSIWEASDKEYVLWTPGTNS